MAAIKAWKDLAIWPSGTLAQFVRRGASRSSHFEKLVYFAVAFEMNGWAHDPPR